MYIYICIHMYGFNICATLTEKLFKPTCVFILMDLVRHYLSHLSALLEPVLPFFAASQPSAPLQPRANRPLTPLIIYLLLPAPMTSCSSSFTHYHSKTITFILCFHCSLFHQVSLSGLAYYKSQNIITLAKITKHTFVL